MSDSLQTDNALRRSPVHRITADAGANFVPCGDAMIVSDYGKPAEELEAAQRLGLCDLSVLSRIGFKGAGTLNWLASQNIALPRATNFARAQPDGSLAAQLGPQEIIVLSDITGSSARAGALRSAWQKSDHSQRGYPVPRRDTHAWFRITGTSGAQMFAKMSAVDLRPHKFENHQLTQTSIARATGIIIRNDLGPVLGFDLLVDGAMADYYVPVLLDAMAEFDGRLVGHQALMMLAEPEG